MPEPDSHHVVYHTVAMISSLQIRGYRGVENFEMSGLERINLLVGTNNSGKTSVLEAIYILISRGDPWSVWDVLWRRGERGSDRLPNRAPEMDVSHLFYGHDAHLGSQFFLSASNEGSERHVSFKVSELKAEHAPGVAREQLPVSSRLGLIIKGQPSPPMGELPTSRSLGLYSDAFEITRRVRRRTSEEDEVPAQFITAESLEAYELVSLYDNVALTPNQARGLSALKFLEPDIERIANQASTQFLRTRWRFIVKLRNREHPLPIRTMGDGMWRMTSTATAIAHCKDVVLLLDEIDTGLHYSVLENLWRLIFGAASELNVQIFATTHSSDCIKSLAHLCYAHR